MNYRLLRTFSLPLGLIRQTFELMKDGSRDVVNSWRFRGALVDAGCCIDAFSKISSSTHLLRGVHFLNSTIAQFSYIGRNSFIQNTDIGSFTSVANDVQCGLGRHPTDRFSTSPLFYRRNNTFGIPAFEDDSEVVEYERISIGCDVWIGARAIIMDGVTIGTGAIVAAGSVVTKDVAPYAIVAGVPAKALRYRFEEEVCDELLATEWWNLPLDEIAKARSQLNRIITKAPRGAN